MINKYWSFAHTGSGFVDVEPGVADPGAVFAVAAGLAVVGDFGAAFFEGEGACEQVFDGYFAGGGARVADLACPCDPEETAGGVVGAVIIIPQAKCLNKGFIFLN
jgi:hypothetical protein